MSFYDDYVADGLCCQSCGTFIGDEPGYPQFCYGCKPKPASAIEARQRRNRATGSGPKGKSAARKGTPNG